MKFMLKTIVLSLLLCGLSTVQVSAIDENGDSFQTEISDYYLIESSTEYTENGVTISRIYCENTDAANSMTGINTESYICKVKFIDYDEFKELKQYNLINSINGNGSEAGYYDLIGDSITIHFSCNYTSNDNTYYKLTSLSYYVVGIYDNFILANTRIEIDNNGIGASTLQSSQTSYIDLGTNLSGTVYGNSNWVPTTSYDPNFSNTATRFYIQVTATRGTGTYTESWKRAF